MNQNIHPSDDASFWQELATKLPWKRTKEHKRLRISQWAQIDINQNGYVSLAEIDKGLRDVVQLPEVFDIKPVIMRAFQAAKNKGTEKSQHSKDYVEQNEYRYLLLYIRQYYEYWVAFTRVDKDHDRRISKNEFQIALPIMREWKIDVSDPDALWREADGDGHGKILFIEFVDWAIKKQLDLPDDDDQDKDEGEDDEDLRQTGGGLKEQQVANNSFKQKLDEAKLWQELAVKLPWKKTEENKKLRQQQWQMIDMNGNGYLSLAEVDKGLRDVLCIPLLFDTKPVIMRAFQAAKTKGDARSQHSNDYVEINEYRYLLLYLRQYYEYWVAFQRIDKDHDRRITKVEFQTAIPLMKEWGIDVSNPNDLWQQADKDGHGMILFIEFVDWAIQKQLDLPDDDDQDKDEESNDELQKKVGQSHNKKISANDAKLPNVDQLWKELAIKLPWKNIEEHKQLRQEQWKMIDINGNGYLSLAEVDKGLRDVLCIPLLFDTKPVIMRAFQAAKTKGYARSQHSNDYVEINEYRYLLLYLRQYYEYWVAFQRIDKDHDRRITKVEFQTAIPLMKEWGIDVSNPDDLWQQADKDGHGMVLFIEFVDWAIQKQLDLPDDDDQDKDDSIPNPNITKKVTHALKPEKLVESSLPNKILQQQDNDAQLWQDLASKLPWKNTEEHKKVRNKQWSQIDMNGNGYLSLAEVDKGLRDVVKIPMLFDVKPVIMRAFQAAKTKGDARSQHSNDYVEINEYRYLLLYLRQYYEYWVAFQRIDKDHDRRITKVEFQTAIPLMKEWGIDVSNPDDLWKQADKDGHGMVLFIEFVDWAIQKQLDLPDDDDQDKDDSIPNPNILKKVTHALKPQKLAESSLPNKILQQQDNDAQLWKDLATKLPWKNTEEHKKLRNKQWSQIDMNGNGYLSLAEVDKGLRDVVKIPTIFDVKPVIMRAFQAAKTKDNARSQHSNDYVEINEYRYLLLYLRQYYEYWVAFQRIDKDHDRRITKVEFQTAIPLMKEWGIDVSNPDDLWKQADKDGHGMVLFIEFVDWAIQKQLDLPDDDDQDKDDSIPNRNITKKVTHALKPQKLAESSLPNKILQQQENDDLLWKDLATKLPWKNTEEHKKLRNKQWSQIDMNGNGYLSLAEVDKGLRDVVKIPTIFDVKPVIMRAFQAAKTKSVATSQYSNDYVERNEYRYLLLYLRQYYEYWVAFQRIDKDHDRRITKVEFQGAVPVMKQWGIDVSNPEALWKEADKDGHGMVLFNEFADWAIQKQLDLPDDDNQDQDDQTSNLNITKKVGNAQNQQKLASFSVPNKSKEQIAKKQLNLPDDDYQTHNQNNQSTLPNTIEHKKQGNKLTKRDQVSYDDLDGLSIPSDKQFQNQATKPNYKQNLPQLSAHYQDNSHTKSPDYDSNQKSFKSNRTSLPPIHQQASNDKRLQNELILNQQLQEKIIHMQRQIQEQMYQLLDMQKNVLNSQNIPEKTPKKQLQVRRDYYEQHRGNQNVAQMDDRTLHQDQLDTLNQQIIRQKQSTKFD